MIRFKINSKLIGDKLSTLEQIAKKKISGLTFGDMKMSYKSGRLSITAINAKTCVTVYIDNVSGVGDGEFVINSSSIISLTKKMKSCDMDFVTEDGRNMTVTYPTGSMSFVIGRAEIFPIVYSLPDTEPMILDLSIYGKALSKAAVFTKEDNDRPALGTVIIDIIGDDVFVVSTDINNMYRLKTPNKDNWPDGRIYISGELAASLDKYIGKDAKTVSVWRNERRVYFHVENVDMYEIPYEGGFFNWRSLDKDFAFDSTLKVNRDEFRSALSRCSISDMLTLSLKVNGLMVDMIAENTFEGMTIKDTLMAQGKDGIDIDIYLSFEPVLKALSVIDSENIVIKRFSQGKFLRFMSEDNPDEWVMEMESMKLDEPKGRK